MHSDAKTVTDPVEARKDRGRDYLLRLAAVAARDYRSRPLRSRASQVFTVAKAGGLSLKRLQEETELGKQTIVDLLRRDRVPSEDARLQALALIAARGSATVGHLADPLGLDEGTLEELVEGMVKDDLLSRAAAGYDTLEAIYLVGPRGDAALDEAIDVLALRRAHPDCWTFYFAITENEAPRIKRAADHLAGPSADVLASTVSSEMSGPELGVLFNARDQRDAFRIARRVFLRICEQARATGHPGYPTLILPPVDQPA